MQRNNSMPSFTVSRLSCIHRLQNIVNVHALANCHVRIALAGGRNSTVARRGPRYKAVDESSNDSPVGESNYFVACFCFSAIFVVHVIPSE
jgi:hypothetical protein